MLKIENLFFAYEPSSSQSQEISSAYLFENFQLEIQKGEWVALLGASGLGKSTLLHLISGILPLKEGKILLEGKPIEKGDVAYMFQKDLLLPYKTVTENLCLPFLLRNIALKEAKIQVHQCLKEFGLEEMASLYPHQLSGGMRQRVALLRTYFCGKKFLLLDEAFSSLDALTKKEMQSFYQEMQKKLSLTTLWITHEVEDALAWADKIYVLAGRPARIVLEKDLRNEKFFIQEKATFLLEKEKCKEEIFSVLKTSESK